MARLKQAVPQLPSTDLARTARFCTETLGFAVRFEYPGFLSVGRDDIELHFWATSNAALAKESSCYVRVEGVEALFRELEAKDAPFGYPLEEKPWGMREMQVNDPDGNAIRFGEPV